MISILIPCYNFNAYPLVSKLEKQALILNINFEIICIDDGSFSAKNEINQKINLLTNSRFIESKKNIGRINNRLLLAEKSQYQWLLFIDVDTYPNSEDFLKNYIDQINLGLMSFGGSIYKEPKNNGFNLRYKFGKKREEVDSVIRNKNPYKYISSRNFIGKKDLIVKVFSKIKNVSYVDSIKDSIDGSDLVIIHTEWNDFKSINFKNLAKKKKFIIFDMRNIYSPSKIKSQGLRYYSIGR